MAQLGFFLTPLPWPPIELTSVVELHPTGTFEGRSTDLATAATATASPIYRGEGKGFSKTANTLSVLRSPLCQGGGHEVQVAGGEVSLRCQPLGFQPPQRELRGHREPLRPCANCHNQVRAIVLQNRFIQDIDCFSTGVLLKIMGH